MLPKRGSRRAPGLDRAVAVGAGASRLVVRGRAGNLAGHWCHRADGRISTTDAFWHYASRRDTKKLHLDRHARSIDTRGRGSTRSFVASRAPGKQQARSNRSKHKISLYTQPAGSGTRQAFFRSAGRSWNDRASRRGDFSGAGVDASSGQSPTATPARQIDVSNFSCTSNRKPSEAKASTDHADNSSDSRSHPSDRAA